MGKYVKRILYKGKEIIFMDAAGVSEVEGAAAWEEMEKELVKETKGCLILVDSRNITMAPAAVSKAKEAAAALKAHPRNRVVFVGMSTLQKSTAQLMARAVRLNAHFSATLEEGKEWLVTEDDKSHQHH